MAMMTKVKAPNLDTGPRRVAILIYSGVTPLDVAGPLEVFNFANIIKRQILYHIVTVAPNDGPVVTRSGITFLPTHAMADLEQPIDTLMVAGGGNPRTWLTQDMVDWLRVTAPNARRFGSICTGAFLLGAAGLLDGRRVTTHWALCADLARLHPAATVEVDPIHIRDGALFSSAGITAGIDLALSLVEEDHGRDLALTIARYLVLYLKRSGGQAQFSSYLRTQLSSVPAIEKAQTWCRNNLHANLSAGTLCRIAGMSERTFVRRFRQETGLTVGEFVAEARLETACRLLTETTLSLKEVAARCGFETTATMRRTFLPRLGVTPRRYREAFSLSDGGQAAPPVTGP
jgi:transcriptional regulator GlxA family with amidase domain